MTDQSPHTTAGRVIVCAGPESSTKLCDTIALLGFTVRAAASFEMLLQELRGGDIEACVIDNGDILDAQSAARLREAHHHVQCVLLIDKERNISRDTIPAIACDILDKPCSETRLQ